MIQQLVLVKAHLYLLLGIKEEYYLIQLVQYIVGYPVLKIVFELLLRQLIHSSD